MKTSHVIITALTLGLLTLAATAHAHKVTIFAWAEGDTVYTESKFSGGKKVQDGKVEVFDGGGALLLDGRTDAAGEFAFKIPRITDLNIVLTAGMGHRNSWKLTAAELGPGAGQSAPAVQTTPAPAAPPPNAAPPDPAGCLSAGDIEAIVSRQLDKRIQPLTRMIADSRSDGPTVSDIMGGIGYIIGLVGLGAYMRYRREARRA